MAGTQTGLSAWKLLQLWVEQSIKASNVAATQTPYREHWLLLILDVHMVYSSRKSHDLPLQEHGKTSLEDRDLSRQRSQRLDEKKLTEVHTWLGIEEPHQNAVHTRATLLSTFVSEVVALPSHRQDSPWNEDDKMQLSKALAKARYSHEVGEITSRLLSTAVPYKGAQPQVLNELLVCASEEGTSII